MLNMSRRHRGQEGSDVMRTMWLLIDDNGFDDSPVGWEDPMPITLFDYQAEPLDVEDEVYGEAPDDYIGRHRGVIED
jgi:hypothetical protein